MHQANGAKHCADTLRNGGGNGRGANAPAKIPHKQQIKYHIDTGGDHQIVKRMLAVAYGVQDAHENVVHHGEDGAAEIESKIGNGFRQYLFRRPHQPQNDGGQCHTRDGEKQSHDETEGYHGVHHFL